MKKNIILPAIVTAQFASGSLWFAANGVMKNLQESFNLAENALGHLTAFVQFGFIAGTFIFAFFTISDRFSPSKVFFVCALLGAVFNSAIIYGEQTLYSLLFYRFLTGFCLAGIYPVGMKIASDYHEQGLGKALGYLVGALVLGTALPHLLRDLTSQLPWKYVLILTSLFSLTGGFIIILFVPDGPFRKASSQIDPRVFFKVFSDRNFRAAAFGYFGHMWELYAFWAFIPIIIREYSLAVEIPLNYSLLAFYTIAGGGIACFIGGKLSAKFGSPAVATFSLVCSGICCLISPYLYSFNTLFLIIFLLFWGMVVVADSPQFSALVARYSEAKTRGTALTIVNSIGFAITIVSIQFLNTIIDFIAIKYLFIFLLIGPVAGVISMKQLRQDG